VPPRKREFDVVADFVFEDGLLYAVVANISERPALKVCKEIRTLVDSSAAYFARKEPTKLEIAVTYRDEDGARRQATIAHDLGIYRDLAYVVPAAEGTDFTD